MSFYGELITESSSINPKNIINKVFKEWKNELYEYALDRYDDLKKSDLKIDDSSIQYNEGKKEITFQINLGDSDGWFDCWIDLNKKETEIGYFDYSFND